MNEYLQSSGIVDVRVDDRMVHGIVATMWIPENHCTRVMVVNEDASNNQVIRSTLKMSVPAGVSLSVLAPEKAAATSKMAIMPISACLLSAARFRMFTPYIRPAFNLPGQSRQRYPEYRGNADPRQDRAGQRRRKSDAARNARCRHSDHLSV